MSRAAPRCAALAALALNLGWLLLGDALPLRLQMCVPVLTV